MPWHRWFVYSYEKALRDECGYTGYQPVSVYLPLFIYIIPIMSNYLKSTGSGLFMPPHLKILPYLTAVIQAWAATETTYRILVV